jgi:hypothetical protein
MGSILSAIDDDHDELVLAKRDLGIDLDVELYSPMAEAIVQVWKAQAHEKYTACSAIEAKYRPIIQRLKMGYTNG